jgi:hypothetical protein
MGSEGDRTMGPAEQLTPAERTLFGATLRRLRARRIPILLAGGYVFSHYSGLWRGTKDLDFLVGEADFVRSIEVLQGLGLRDYYEVETYDRSWIYRAYQPTGGAPLIVDAIYRFPNRVDAVDASWFARGVPGQFAGEAVRFVAPEDLIWMKLFIVQRERCDWPDLLNIIRGQRGQLDWEHLLRRAGEHWRLLGALVDVYDWLSPRERDFIPDGFRAELNRRRLTPEAPRGTRATFFDSRPWLTAPGAGLTGAASEAGPAAEDVAEPVAPADAAALSAAA